MAKTMTAPHQPMTDGQIENVVAKFRDALRKHRGEFSSEPVQLVLGVDNLGMELLTPFRSRVEAVSNLIIRRVRINRVRTPQKALGATGRRQYTDRSVVDAMPRGDGDEVEIGFFKPRQDAYDSNGLISDANLEKEFAFHGFVPADPVSLSAVNEDDPAFADEHPNGTHWKDVDGRWCYAAFSRWGGGRSVSVRRGSSDWGGGWWFAGVRK